jgi:hypothetical protein
MIVNEKSLSTKNAASEEYIGAKPYYHPRTPKHSLKKYVFYTYGI